MCVCDRTCVKWKLSLNMRLLCNGNGSIPEKNVVGIARHKVGRCRVREGNIFPFLSSLLKNVPTAAEKSCNSVDCKEDKAVQRRRHKQEKTFSFARCKSAEWPSTKNGQEWPTMVMAVVLVMVTGGRYLEGALLIFTLVLISSKFWPRVASILGLMGGGVAGGREAWQEQIGPWSTPTHESSFLHVLARITLHFLER